jgi:hypothetical protein
MTVGTEYADDLKHELMTEMADNFFSRRRRLDERLEAYAGLREKVERQGRLTLARWRAFRELLLGGAEADRFLARLGFDPATLAAFPTTAFQPRHRRPLALTAAGRYRKAVAAAYEALRQELENYNEGTFVPDPRDPRRMARVPGFDHLRDTGRELNDEIAAVNSCQCPSDMLQFAKSLDPVRQQQERACGGIGDACRLDEALAYKPLDLDHPGVPVLPTPPPLDDIADELEALADRLYAADPARAKAALAAGK